MELIELGSAGIQVSRAGLGTVKFGRNQGVNYPHAFTLPTDNEILKLLACAQELGINFLDTAPAYGISEERLGKLIHRDDWVIATKVGETFVNNASHFDFSPQAIRASIERSLQRLQTDFLDMVLVHSSGEDKKIIEEDQVFNTLNELKRAGKIRAFGMSTKTIEGGKLAVEHSDVVMVTYNPIQTADQEVIQFAHAKNKGIVIKKSLASGHVNKIAGQDPVQAAMSFIFQEPGVHSVILGTLNQEHLRHNVKCIELAT
jgi:aryl-alcohol dehydrogenase-like predicted oxidoreductase